MSRTLAAPMALASATLFAASLFGCEQPAQSPQQPTYGAPTYGQPAYGQPGYSNTPPAYGQPGYNPGYNTPPQGYPPGPQAPPTYPQPQPAPIPATPPAQPGPMPVPQPTPAPTSPQPAPAPTTPGIPGFPFPFPGTPAPGGTAPSGSSATPIDPNLASAAVIPLTALAATNAQGMQREGGVVAGQFQEGQTLESQFQMMPGKCYAVLAVGTTVQETDLSLVALTPVPGVNPSLAQDTGSGPKAVLGGSANCYHWTPPFGINAKFVVKATHGSGIIAAQLYSK